jgi:phosphoribulokinase
MNSPVRVMAFSVITSLYGFGPVFGVVGVDFTAGGAPGMVLEVSFSWAETVPADKQLKVMSTGRAIDSANRVIQDYLKMKIGIQKFQRCSVSFQRYIGCNPKTMVKR